MLFRHDGRICREVGLCDAILERRQHAFEIREKPREEIGLGRAGPINADRIVIANQAPGGLAGLIGQQPLPAGLFDANQRQGRCRACRLECSRKRFRWCASCVQGGGVCIADLFDAITGSFRGCAENGFAIEPRQVVLAIIETARVGAQRRDVRAGATVAEQLDSYP
jgi:hypothetical protein